MTADEYGGLFGTSCDISQAAPSVHPLPVMRVQAGRAATTSFATSTHRTPITPPSPLTATSKLVHVSSIDFVILSIFAFDPIREDMSRRGWWDPRSADNDVKRLLAFSAVPLVGPAAYLLLRPPLPEK